MRKLSETDILCGVIPFVLALIPIGVLIINCYKSNPF